MRLPQAKLTSNERSAGMGIEIFHQMERGLGKVPSKADDVPQGGC
jgi:hypothetical protein